MIKKQLFKPALLSIAVSSALYSGAGIAQQDANSALQDENTEIIAVTGIRGSLIRAQAVKQDNSSIVEALSAEDIGKLPDSSIAESLSRLPGLAGERSGGRTAGISVRGFKEDFTGTTLNGREVLGIGDNRGVEYDLYPAEIMTGATIYKTTDALLMTTGIGGTVDLQTVRPLQAQETLTVNAVYDMTANDSDNPEFDDNGFRVAGAWVGKFMDDTLGVALAVASTESPTNQRKYGVWGYSEDDAGIITPTGLDIFAISKELKRDTISGVVQWQPTDDLDIVVDYLTIDYEDSGILRGFIEPFASVNISGSGANNTGRQVGANPVLRTDPENTEGTLDVLGLNLEYALNDEWTASFDVAYNESEKTYLRAESYAGIGRSGSLTADQLGSREFTMSPSGIFFTGTSGMDFGDFNSIKLTGPQVWGGGLASQADLFASNVLQGNGSGNTYSFLNAQDGFINYADFTEELTTARFDIEGLVEWGVFNKITFGAFYSDRTKTKDNNGDFVTTPDYPFGNGNPDGSVDSLIPEQYRFGLADLSWAGLGNVVAYDGFGPYNDGTYTRVQAETLEPDRLGDTYEINEEVMTLFVRGDFETDIGDMTLFGNVGLQFIDTDQSSNGFIAIVESDATVCLDDATGTVDQACAVTDGADYSMVLPSLNMSLQLTDEQFIRFAASKTISRARIDQMSASGFVKFNQNIELIATPDTEAAVREFGTPWSKQQGSPTLRPLESNNFDISYENYFAPDGYIAVALFYKDLVNWTENRNELIDFTNDATNGGADYFIPGFHDRIIDVAGTYGPLDTFYNVGDLVTPPRFGFFDSFQDGLTGSVSGVELTANVPLNVFADALEGFGVAATASFIDAELDNGSAIPGQSDTTYGLTAYYEMSGWEFRVAGTKRSEFLTYQRGGSNKIAEATRDGVTIVDAQISYDFDQSNFDALEGLRISLQGQNLTDVEEETVDGNGLVTERRSFGPRYMVNFNYSFY
ncbi:TonB-dependent receptor [Glaciecola siphonariae]|uniref:TonB-dependent receptor n=1 Tax=Glaciecola siphonariae TaxID=521012 RepID=A0ABV9LU10_9ALTE